MCVCSPLLGSLSLLSIPQRPPEASALPALKTTVPLLSAERRVSEDCEPGQREDRFVLRKEKVRLRGWRRTLPNPCVLCVGAVSIVFSLTPLRYGFKKR